MNHKLLPNDFNWKKYVKLNSDLENVVTNKLQAIEHYKNFGIIEKRQYTNQKKVQNEQNQTINILIVVVSCKKNQHLWSKIKNRTNEKMIILCGLNNDENSHKLNEKETYYDGKESVLYLNCDDGYGGLPEKIILMIEYVLTKLKDITHIIKIDDHDNYFTDENIKNLYKYDELKKYDYVGQKKNHNGENCKSNWHFEKVLQNNYWHNKRADVSNVTWFDGGCSYILNKKAMKIINDVYNSHNILELRQKEIYEDIMIGRIMQSKKIIPYLLNYNIKGDK